MKVLCNFVDTFSKNVAKNMEKHFWHHASLQMYLQIAN